MNNTIRAMDERDRSAVLEMMRDFYSSDAVSTNGSEEIFNNDIDKCIGDSPYLEGYVFDNGHELQGYAMLAKSFSTEFGKRCIWVEDIYIRAGFRSLGLGKVFLSFIEQKYPDSVLRLEVEHSNERAVAVYEKCGYGALEYLEMKKQT